MCASEQSYRGQTDLKSPLRGVFGASSLNIMWRMTREFLLLVTIANAIALGLVYFGWNKALQTGLLFMAFLAVASQTLKAAWANPANSSAMNSALC